MTFLDAQNAPDELLRPFVLRIAKDLFGRAKLGEYNRNRSNSFIAQ